MKTMLRNAVLVTASSAEKGSVDIENGRITAIRYGEDTSSEGIDLQGLLLFAGGIDAHVHFREPGLTAKGDIFTESRAALLGGYTAFIDMPNTLPPATTPERLREKCALAAGRSWCHYAFHRGAVNGSSLPDTETEAGFSPALKVFLGSSTGDMLVDRSDTLETLFHQTHTPILIHSEDERIIRGNRSDAAARYGDTFPVTLHPLIRSREACIESTRRALDAAVRYGTRLHILHLSTAEELELIREARRQNPRITAETSVNYLWFSEKDYERLGSRIQCNPAIKSEADREALIAAVKDGTIDSLGSDHAPHLAEEKQRPYPYSPSGIPSIQEAIPVLLTLSRKYDIPLTRIAALLSERIASILGIEGRGRLEEGAAADLVAVDPAARQLVGKPAYKCGWSPYEGETLQGRIAEVWLGGKHVVSDGRLIASHPSGEALSFRK